MAIIISLYSCLDLHFLPVIHLVELAPFVLALLHILAVAVDDDLDFLVQTDDALVAALLFLACRFGYGKLVINGNLAFLFVCAFVCVVLVLQR